MRRFATVVLAVLFASSAFASGFQVAAQGARAMGMGLAYTAVADDASAIFFNPAGLAFQESDIVAGIMVARNVEGKFESARGTEEQRTAENVLPELYASWSMGGAKAGIGVYTPFGLPIRWENP